MDINYLSDWEQESQDTISNRPNLPMSHGVHGVTSEIQGEKWVCSDQRGREHLSHSYSVN